MTGEEATKIVDKAVCELREFFPHVQVLVSWRHDEDGCTADLFRGKGNWYARIGMAREFLTRDESQTTAKEIADRLNTDDDD